MYMKLKIWVRRFFVPRVPVTCGKIYTGTALDAKPSILRLCPARRNGNDTARELARNNFPSGGDENERTDGRMGVDFRNGHSRSSRGTEGHGQRTRGSGLNLICIFMLYATK